MFLALGERVQELVDMMGIGGGGTGGGGSSVMMGKEIREKMYGFCESGGKGDGGDDQAWGTEAVWSPEGEGRGWLPGPT